MLAVARRRQANQGYRRIHPMHMPNASIFRGKLKFTKAAVAELVHLTDAYLIEPNPNGLSMSKEDQVCIFLSSMGSNSFQSVICDRFGCSQQTISNIIERVLHALTDPVLVSRFIQFPIDDAAWRSRVQLERVQYSAHFFSFITAATGKATTAAELNSSCGETLALATMKSFASFIVHNGLFANRELLNEHGTMGKCSYTTWLDWLQRLLAFRSARLWLITHVLFNHEMAATFLFSTDSGVREFFQKVIVKTMCVVDEEGDASEKCLDAAVSSVTAHTLANTMRVFPRLSYLLANLLGLLPFKHNAAFRTEPVNFYRALIDLADRKNMMLAIVRGGILNNLLSLFNALGSDLSTLHRRDTHVYEDLHRVIADAFRTIRPKVDPHPNPYYNDIVVVRTDEVPDLRMFQEFMQPTGGHVKCIHNLIDILRRATRNNGHSLGWVSHGILYLCWNNNKASNAVMDMVCQSSGNMVTETATDLLMGLLSNLFFMRDGLAAARFEHIFYKVQLTSTHAHPSVQGLIEFQNVSQNRYEVFIRVALHLVECLPDVFNMLNADPRAKELLGTLNTLAMLKSATNAWCKQYHETYEDVRTAGSGGATSDSETDFDTTNDDSLMDEEEEEKSSERGGEGEEEGRAGGGGGVRPSQHDHIIVSDGVGHQYKHRVIRRVKQSSSSASPGQLSPSSGMGAMTISSPASIVGEKRPLPPTEEGEETDGSTDGRSDRKRSIGETMWRREGGGGGGATATATPTAATPINIDDYTVSAVSPMDDSDLLISSSTASTSRGMPACPPPAYELIGGGGGASTGRRSPVARVTPLVPPPLPPRPIAKARPKSPLVTDEFVQKHKEE